MSKRKKAVVISLTILLLLIAAIAPLACIGNSNKIAVITLKGPIQAEVSSFLFGVTVTPELVRDQLRRAERDGAVKAIVLQVESPGGTVAACQEIVIEIERIKKPIVVSMGTLAASGGYFISAKADKIVALPGTLTGSIGVISQMPNIKGLYDKLGIKMETFKGGKYKDMYMGLRELTPEEQKIMQEMTDEFYDQFVRVVAEGRNLSEEKVRNLATGQLYTGVKAKELRLVDELGGLDTAINSAASLAGIERPDVEFYRPKPFSLLGSLFGMSLVEWRNFLQMRVLGVEAAFLLETLDRSYPVFQYR